MTRGNTVNRISVDGMAQLLTRLTRYRTMLVIRWLERHLGPEIFTSL